MPRVSINERAFHDPRLTVAGRAMKMSPPALGWKLAFAWSQVTDQGHPHLVVRLVAACIGRKPEIVRDALIDVELAVALDDEVLDLSPMRMLFGDYQWLGELRETASAGGTLRAKAARRNPDGTFAPSSLHSRVLERLRRGPVKRRKLCKELRVRRSKTLAAVRDLLAVGQVVEAGNGELMLAGTSWESEASELDADSDWESDDAVPDSDVEPELEVPGTARYPAASSALAPAPALAPAHVSDARARPDAQAREGTGNPESPTVPLESLLDDPELVPLSRRRQVARELWAYQNRRRAELDPEAPSLPFNAVPGGNADAIVLALARYSPAQCKHAIDVFAAEGKCLAEDDRDPLEYLNGRTNWKGEQLDRAAGSTPKAVRKRFKKPGPPTTTTSTQASERLA